LPHLASLYLRPDEKMDIFAGYTATHLNCCGDETGGPEVTGADRQTPVKHLKGIRGVLLRR